MRTQYYEAASMRYQRNAILALAEIDETIQRSVREVRKYLQRRHRPSEIVNHYRGPLAQHGSPRKMPY